MMFESWKLSVANDEGPIAASKDYRCYLTDGEDRIRSYEQIACEDDGAAALKAQQLLAASHFTSAELWQGKRLVGKWANADSGRPAPVDDAGER